MKKFKITALFITLACLVLCAMGCSKLTKQNYDQISVGMDYKEVSAMLGGGGTCDAAMGAKNCMWGDEQKNITVKFIADKAVLKTCKGI
jgi:hypothetical protein